MPRSPPRSKPSRCRLRAPPFAITGASSARRTSCSPAEDPRPAVRRKPAPAGGVVRGADGWAWRGHGAAGEGAVVHQPARSRFGCAHRRRVHRARGRRHQAHQPVRRRDRRHDCRGLRTRARSRRSRGVRRHRRAQSRDRRGHRGGDRRHVHRSRGGAVGRRGGPADPGPQDEHARGRRELRARGGAGSRAAVDSRRRARAGARRGDARHGTTGAIPRRPGLTVPTKRSPPRANGRRSGSHGACART